MNTLITTCFSLGCTIAVLMAVGSATAAQKPSSVDSLPTDKGDLRICIGNHATLALQSKETTIYIDPVGGAASLKGLPKPDLILITHGHGDHFDKETLSRLAGPQTRIVAPESVAGQLPERLQSKTTALANGEFKELSGVKVEAIPAYNQTAERLKFHPKGAGNGYVISVGGKRIYVSGDTEDIPDMLALKDIDVAFVCMNLPYTMTPEQAARAVRTFKPKIVFPYHSRGSDVTKFKELVGSNSGIEVRLRDWYSK